MCIIVYIPRKVRCPSIDTLRRCWESNAHGAGIMYQWQGKVHAEKGIMDEEEFIEVASTLFAMRNSNGVGDIALHFRIASHGAVNKRNTHPWKIADDKWLMHNGIIHWLGDNPNVSDTYRLSKMLKDYPMTDDNVEILGQAIGHNKLLIMEPNKTSIVNERLWTYCEGVAYSNHSFMPRQAVQPLPFEFNRYIHEPQRGNRRKE